MIEKKYHISCFANLVGGAVVNIITVDRGIKPRSVKQIAIISGDRHQ